MSKRLDYITWDEYFMGIALLSAQRSKDPSTQVGACIVNQKKRIVGIGYNGFPQGCDDDDFPWGKKGLYTDTKYPYVVHAEANAILNSWGSLDGTWLYTTLFPCNECAKLIIQSGISQIFYLDNKYKEAEGTLTALRMFRASGVNLQQLTLKPLVLA